MLVAKDKRCAMVWWWAEGVGVRGYTSGDAGNPIHWTMGVFQGKLGVERPLLAGVWVGA